MAESASTTTGLLSEAQHQENQETPPMAEAESESGSTTTGQLPEAQHQEREMLMSAINALTRQHEAHAQALSHMVAKLTQMRSRMGMAPPALPGAGQVGQRTDTPVDPPEPPPPSNLFSAEIGHPFPDRFPVNTKERVKPHGWDHLLNVADPLKIVAPFPEFPQLNLKFDIDSIYTYSSSLEQLLVGLCCKGNEAIMKVQGSTNHFNSEKSSRFHVEVDRNLPHPPIVIGRKTKGSIPLHWFPNSEMCTLVLPKLNGEKMHVSMHKLAEKNIGKSNCFNKEEMAVLNSCINKARLNALKELEHDAGKASAFNDWSGTGTVHGSHTFRKSRNMGSNHLMGDEIALFASKFELAMKHIAEYDGTNDPSVEDLWDERCHQITSDMHKGVVITKPNMIAVAKEFQRGLLFVATCANTKHLFTEKFKVRPGEEEDWDSEEQRRKMQELLDANREEITKKANDWDKFLAMLKSLRLSVPLQINNRVIKKNARTGHKRS